MSSSLMKILVSLGLDSTEFDKGLGEAEGKAKRIGSNIASGLSMVGGAVVMGGIAAAGAGLAALTGFLASSIGPASDLEESVSKVGVVFGDWAEDIYHFADSAATALGMTKNEALAAAGTYGNLFKSMGIGDEATTDMSTGLVTLAADLASFNNMDPTLVLDKLRAGLTGETEPLKSLGVNLNAAMVEAKALEMGLYDGEGAISAAAKAQASYALVMEQTSLAQGDFARTSGGLANQQRILKASFGDLKTTIGAALLPIVTKLMTALTGLFSDPKFKGWIDSFVGKLTELAAWVEATIPVVIAKFQEIGAWFTQNEGVIVGILAALGVAVAVFVYTTVIPAAIAAIGAMLPIIAVMAAIAAVAYLVYEAWTNNWGGIRDIITNLWYGTLEPIFTTLITWLKTNIPVAIAALSAFWSDVLLPAITAVWAFIQENVLPLFVTAAETMNTVFSAAVQFLAELWETTLLPALTAVWTFMNTSVFPLFIAIAEFLGAVFGVAVEALAGLWVNVLAPAIKTVYEWIADKIQPALDALLPVIQTAAEWIGGKLAPAFQAVADAISAVIGWLGDMTTKLKNLELPDWLTPGSPTPFELGLLGIGDAMRKLNTQQLPDFRAGLELTPNVAGMGAFKASTAAQTPGNTETNNNIGPIYINDRSTGLDLIEIIRTM